MIDPRLYSSGAILGNGDIGTHLTAHWAFQGPMFPPLLQPLADSQSAASPGRKRYMKTERVSDECVGVAYIPILSQYTHEWRHHPHLS